MISWMRGRLTYANVLVTALAFLVLAGTSVAQDAASSAATLITGKQVKNGTITGKDVKNHSLSKKDFKGSVRGAQGIQGEQGVQGIQGLKGDKGDKGDAGATNVVVRTNSASISSGSQGTAEVFCNAGERAVGGGGNTSVSSGRLFASRPGVKTLHFSGLSFNYGADAPAAGATPDAWSVSAESPSSAATLSAYVICAAP
jgi:hypothetical protein